MNGSGNSQQWWRFVRQIPRTLAVKLIHGYRLMLSPLIGNQCRFYPTCSHYAEQALLEHGFVRGSWLAARRLGRCHPFNPGGVDEVPPALSQVAVCSQHKSNQL